MEIQLLYELYGFMALWLYKFNDEYAYLLSIYIFTYDPTTNPYIHVLVVSMRSPTDLTSLVPARTGLSE